MRITPPVDIILKCWFGGGGEAGRKVRSMSSYSVAVILPLSTMDLTSDFDSFLSLTFI